MRFSDVLPRATQLVAEAGEHFGNEVTLVRDLYGRIRIAVAARPESLPRSFARDFNDALAAYGPGKDNVFLFGDRMFAPEAVFESRDRQHLHAANGLNIFLLDRQVMGQEWSRAPIDPGTGNGQTQRVTFFGLKGGVGRSTALAVLAWRLARIGKRVLVVDLDLESPGIGSLLLPQERLPDFGVADWFVESAVGQADEPLAAGMVASSPLTGDAEAGEILVAAAAGRDEGDYLAKLSRAYLELRAAGGVLHFGERVYQMLHTLEARFKPDVVFLDSRAGMHDIAAVAVTRLDALAFLFAVDGAYTWDAFRLLFQHWRRDRRLLERFRGNLRMVAGLVPDTGRPEYFANFRQHAYDLFTSHIYDPAGGDEPGADEAEPFSFDLNAADAPHDLLHVNWNRSFFAFDPVRHPEAVDDGLLQGGFGDFVHRAGELILGAPLRW